MTRKIATSADPLEPLLRFTKNDGEIVDGKVSEYNSVLMYGAMPTASLPGLDAAQAGSTAFDTDLGKLVVWTGAAWETVTSA